MDEKTWVQWQPRPQKWVSQSIFRVVLCRLITKLTMKTVEGVNDRPQSRAECLGNLRRAIKLIPKFKWDEYDLLDCDNKKAN
ncbi:MAG: hypothetical protein KDD45_17260 [Bdellovibrionales bacterium]|nr:hypothetical protein [Bdellovibrionales bacterium]